MKHHEDDENPRLTAEFFSNAWFLIVKGANSQKE